MAGILSHIVAHGAGNYFSLSIGKQPSSIRKTPEDDIALFWLCDMPPFYLTPLSFLPWIGCARKTKKTVDFNFKVPIFLCNTSFAQMVALVEILFAVFAFLGAYIFGQRGKSKPIGAAYYLSAVIATALRSTSLKIIRSFVWSMRCEGGRGIWARPRDLWLDNARRCQSSLEKKVYTYRRSIDWWEQ